MVEIIYPVGPLPAVKNAPPGFRMLPGEGINAAPFEAEKILDLTVPFGQGSGLVEGLIFQLGRWGYESTKMYESIEVSPQFTEYYNKVIGEKSRIGAEIKNAFMSVSKAVEDFELLEHDVRKYKEYLDYFQEWKKAQAEEDKEAEKRAMHTIRAMFVDTIDIHTGEGVSLRSIAPRWSTIIADFLALSDEDDTPEKIQKKIGITKAEAVILTTKNKLFKEWRDKLFFPTVKSRYKNLKTLLEARRRSIKEYIDDLRPLISRYKAIKEIRETPEGRAMLNRIAWFHPHAQAMSIDTYEIWAWKPFVVEEVFKAPRESYDTYTLKEAGFNQDEIKELKKQGKKDIPALPVKPIVDKWVRKIIEQIEDPIKGYGVKITTMDIYNVVKELNEHYLHPLRTAQQTGTKMGFRWPYSPYFVFVQLPVMRTVIKSPDGSLFEDIWIQPMKAYNSTQNIIIGRLLEVTARNKKAEQDISLFIGESAKVGNIVKKTQDILEQTYPEIYAEEKKQKIPKKQVTEKVEKTKDIVKDLREKIAKFVDSFGIKLMIAYPGPYEKLMQQRMTKMMQRAPGIAFRDIDLWLKKAGGVPSSVQIEYR